MTPARVLQHVQRLADLIGPRLIHVRRMDVVVEDAVVGRERLEVELADDVGGAVVVPLVQSQRGADVCWRHGIEGVEASPCVGLVIRAWRA